MLIVSTGFKFQLLSGNAFTDIFENSVVLLYGNAQPDSPNNAPGASPIAMVTAGGGAFTFGSPTNGLNWTLSTAGVATPSTADWTLTALASSTIVWGRLCANGDSLVASSTDARFDFGCNPVDGIGFLVTGGGVITSGEQRTVDFSLYGIPPL